VSRTLFEEYAEHRAGKRGDEEIGWVLLGVRRETDAVVLATLPAGRLRDASSTHVAFNGTAQAVASTIVRQWNRRLVPLGVVHTHPGSMRHPSDGDLRGDRDWVGQLRGREGVFAIGTADAKPGDTPGVLWQPKAGVQCWGRLRLSWYSLREGQYKYQPLPVGLTIGPDFASPLRPVWPAVEAHAERLERLARQFQKVRFEPVMAGDRPMLEVTIPLADPKSAVRVLLGQDEVRYHLLLEGQELAADQDEPLVDRGVYLLLAELARRS